MTDSVINPTTDAPAASGERNGERASTLLIAAFAATAIFALLAPRFLAYWPAITGLLAFILFPLFCKKPLIPQKTLLLWSIAILGLCAASTLWAIDPSGTFERCYKTALIILPGLGLIAAAKAVPLETLRLKAPLIAWTIVLASVFCALETAADFPVHRLLEHKLAGQEIAYSTMNRSIIALLCMIFPALGIASFHKDKKLAAALFAGALLMTVFTDSQSAQLGFALALLCFLFFPYSHKRIWKATSIILMTGILCAPFLAIWMFHALAPAIAQMPWIGRGGGFGGERLEIWDKIGRYALKKPLFGFGMDATRAIDDFDTAQIYRKGITELHPHNFAIQLWIEFGFLGAMLGAALIYSIVVKLKDLSYETARIALPTFVLLLSPAAFGYGLWQGWFTGLMIFLIALSTLTMRLYETSDHHQAGNENEDEQTRTGRK